jgi:CDP-glycerol glycerophosphotransferase
MTKRSKTPYPVQWLFGLISLASHLFFKKEKGRIVLTSFHGDGYRGNTRVLYEELQKHSTLKPVWLSRNKHLVQQLQQKYGSTAAYPVHSLAGLRAIGTADSILLTHGTSDYPFLYLPRRANLIQTYHGLPTKRGEYLRPNPEHKPSLLHRMILQYRFSPINMFLSTSPGVSKIFAARFGLNPTQLVETGYPAYDSLIRSKNQPPPKAIQQDWPDAAKRILYAPTFRRKTKTRWFPFEDRDLESIAQFLESENALLCIRPHPNEKFDISAYRAVSPRFVDASQNTIENIYGLLPSADAIVTDYSSIYLEGLLLDIPAIFLPYDVEEYERGLPFPYDEMTPGPKPVTQKAFLRELKRALDRDGSYADDRERVRKTFFSQADDQATERVIRLLEELSEKETS